MRQSPHRRPLATAATTVTVVLVMICAFFVKSVSEVNVYSGAIAGIAFVAGCPAIVGMFLLDWQTFRWQTAMWSLLLFGLVTGVLGFIYTDNYSTQLTGNCVWQ